MKTDYEDSMTMRAARDRYFDVNSFGPSGGYEDAWVDFKLGPVPMPFPNTPARVRAVRHHDLHHILTGFDTDIVGEFEISAWELGAGCKDFVAAWVLNLGGLTAGGLVRCPARTFRAFVRGRRERSTYGEELEAMLDLPVREARARFTPLTGQLAPEATWSDVALYALALMTGTLVGLCTMVLVLPLAPIGVCMNLLRRRGTAAQPGQLGG